MTLVKFGPILIGFVFAGLSVALIQTPLEYALTILGTYALGFLMFLQATRSVRPRGASADAEPRPMTPSNRLLYRIGYLAMALATLLTFILYSASTPQPSLVFSLRPSYPPA